jgi:hypothetical protein
LIAFDSSVDGEQTRKMAPLKTGSSMVRAQADTYKIAAQMNAAPEGGLTKGSKVRQACMQATRVPLHA